MSEPSEGRYTVGTWSGVPNYQCTACPYATTSGPPAIDEHWRMNHQGVEPVPPTPAPKAPETAR